MCYHLEKILSRYHFLSLKTSKRTRLLSEQNEQKLNLSNLKQELFLPLIRNQYQLFVKYKKVRWFQYNGYHLL